MDEQAAARAGAPGRRGGHLDEVFDLSGAERAALAAVLGPAQHLPRDHVLKRDGAEPTHLFLLVDGWVASSITVASGRQQTVKIHLPRDVLGAPSLCVTRTAECLTAITPITVRPVSRGDLMGVLARFPRIAAAHFLGAQRERLTLMEVLALMGQTDGSVRIAGMLVELFDRLGALGLAEQGTMPFPLTQGQVGDLVGLSPVHVSRKFGAMERAGLIQRGVRTINLLDLRRLRSMTGLPRHAFVREPEWINFT
ncbi:Crp/Fnr family transcriptional regulator [Caulobacter radicis]|uniref:Crp/Fnr family transcriptional regulator n=1 Tax=Caulobacter radicis TaxID=2172650 RepID=A0A2T9IVQ0_9CAUL|nr:Crp/Fnr family transcriptional regulator [Caulobacter radicis]